MMDKGYQQNIWRSAGTMEDDTTRRMTSSFYPHTGRNPKKLVCRLGDAQRYY
jgi:hypothetical protein